MTPAPESQSAGKITVPVEVAALVAYVAAAGYVSPAIFQALVIELGLAARVEFSPEANVSDEGDLLPGDPYIAWSKALLDVIEAGRPHLRVFARGLN